MIEKLGDRCLYIVEQSGQMGIFLYFCLLSAATPPHKLFPIIRQIHFIGAIFFKKKNN